METENIAEKVFAEGIMEDIRDYLGPEYRDVECRLVEVEKNNGIIRTGINFIMPGEKAGPNIYVEEYLDRVKHGEPLEEVKKSVAGSVMDSLDDFWEIPEEIMEMNLEEVRDHISVRLVNTRRNKEMLSAMPHMRLEDLSAIFFLAYDDAWGVHSIKVSDKVMDHWGISREELYETAMRNVSEEEPMLETIEEMLFRAAMPMPVGNTGNHLKDAPEEMEQDQPYTLSTKRGIFGAAAMIYPGVMEKISSLFPEGFYILPSSVHEVLICPKRLGRNPRELMELVREVNRNHVKREAFLSDHVYEYDRERKRIRRVAETMQKERREER